MRLWIVLLVASSLFSQTFQVHQDLGQTGTATSESILTPAVLSSGAFQKLGSYSVDGWVVAQPLVAQVTIGGHPYTALIVATLANSVYAFDTNSPSSAPLWHTNLGAVRTSYTGCCGGDLFFYGQGLGIVSTPVIDAAHSLLYVVNTNSTPTWVLWKIDLTTGSVSSSVTISGQFPGTGDTGDPTSGGNLVFFPTRELQRPGLTLASGNVYIAFGGVGDNRPWHGWLFGYDASTLSQTGVFCTTPSSYGGAIWQSGGAPAVDGSGNLYVTTGNDNNNGDSTEYGETVLKLSPTLSLLDWFTPSNFATLDSDDADVSSNWPILIPGTNLMVVAGKDFNVYVLDTTCMGHLQGSSGCGLQTFKTNASGTVTSFSGSYGGIFMNSILYLPTTAGSIYAFAFSAGSFNSTPITTQTNTYGFPGPAQLAGSINGTSNGIVWTTTAPTSTFTATAAGTLRAINPVTLAEYWNSGTKGADALGNLSKFSAPTIAGGKVFVGTESNTVVVFGLTASSQMSGQATLSGGATIH